MTFKDFLKILDKYYRPHVEPFYTNRKPGQADFVRTLFVSATVGQDEDFLQDISLPQKIFSTGEVSEKVAQTILSDLDKERFIDFLSRLESIESTNRLCKAFGIDSEIKTVLHEHIYNCFIEYLENTDNTNKEQESNPQKSNKKTVSHNTAAIDKAITVEPISLNLNNMRFFASENNGIKVIDSDTEKNRCSVTYHRDFDNVNEPKAFAMIAYIYNNPTSWADYADNELSFFYRGQLSLNITAVILEIKYTWDNNVRAIAIEKRIKNNNGSIEGKISLADYDIDRLATIIEICFTVFNENCSSVGEHMIEINHLSLGSSRQDKNTETVALSQI